ncbi:MAG: hypothetical protein ABEJ40_03000 [Haloarculaceae archaeon]
MEDEPDLPPEGDEGTVSHRSGGVRADPTLELSTHDGYVGDTITLDGRGFPVDEELTVRWHSSEGQWGILEAREVTGPQYQHRVESVLTVETDESGEFTEEWTIPEDYGGSHVLDVRYGNETLATANFEITPHFEINRTEAPLGGMFTITGYGIGPSLVRNNYQITWDNGFLGFVTGVMNRGTGTAQVRAVGPPGEHVVQVWRNSQGVPFLQNNTQSEYGPVAGERTSSWTVEVTDPEEPPRTAWVDKLFDESPISIHYPDVAADSDAELEITPTSGQSGTSAFISGENFPPDTEVELRWYRHEGQPVRDAAVTPTPKPGILPDVTTDGDGSFQVEVTVPADQGSTRPITAAVDGRELAVTGFMMQPSIETFAPVRGPVGTEIEIELSGIGWTAYENSPFFVYDNKPLGVVSGSTGSEGDGTVRTVLQATGEPGYHFIDVYPALFDMREDEPRFELTPHLSYLDNHPVRPLPALHFAFEVTE